MVLFPHDEKPSMAIVIFFIIFVVKSRHFEATILIDLQIENIVLE